jgi:quinol monooxygenase YgiN
LGIITDLRTLRRQPGLHFAKLLGTSGSRFSPIDATPSRWLLLASWCSAAAAQDVDESPVVQRWAGLARESWRATLQPIGARGRWSRRIPFSVDAAADWSGPVAVITRARLVLRHAAAFWRAVPDVVADLRTRPGLATAFGIGEAPLGVQGTFSVWRDSAAMHDFAYTRAAHRRAISRTADVGWYAEELFARFALLESKGTIDGHDPVRLGAAA